MSPIRILVVDDHPVVRDGLVAMLNTQPDFEVVAEASSGMEAIEKAASFQPDLILLDLEMPGMDGVEALQQIRQRDPEMRAIAFTAFDTDERILGAIRAGARGYLLKGVPRSELFEAIRIVSRGGSLLQPVVTARLLDALRSPSTPPDSQTHAEAITRRELEVLRLLVQGKTNREIAEALVITERTAKFHVSSLLRKLGAANRTEAAHIAVQRGLVQP